MDDRYAAGLFDGEGFIRINKQQLKNSIHIRYNLYGGINMTYRPIIEMLHKEYGGNLGCKPVNPKYPQNRAQFGWIIASQVAATFLRRIRPYSVVKADEIDVALEFQNHINSNPYIPAGRGLLNSNREEIFKFRDELFHKIRILKKPIFEPFTFLSKDPK